MSLNKPLEELKEALQKLEKTELDLTVSIIKKLKTILKENYYLKQVPISQRGEVSSI